MKLLKEKLINFFFTAKCNHIFTQQKISCSILKSTTKIFTLFSAFHSKIRDDTQQNYEARMYVWNISNRRAKSERSTIAVSWASCNWNHRKVEEWANNGRLRQSSTHKDHTNPQECGFSSFVCLLLLNGIHICVNNNTMDTIKSREIAEVLPTLS